MKTYNGLDAVTEPAADGIAPQRQSMAWVGELTKGEKGPHAIVANAVLAICNDTPLAGLLMFDEFSRTTMVSRAPPAPFEGARQSPGPYPRQLTEADVTLIQSHLQRVCDIRVSEQVAHQAVRAAALQNRFDPVTGYLNSLHWDGKLRLETWLSRYLGAEQSDYTKAAGRMFFISMVARALQPGCKVDHMVILEGPQGASKSSACEILANRWFSDSLPDLRQKDASSHLNGKWLVEVAELSALSKADLAALKAYITRREERYRPPYGRTDVTEPRTCVFIGTTNELTYLRDPSGGRRFWPVRTGDLIDLDALRSDRDQLFAEAVHLYRHGAKWWPDRDFEREHMRPQQESRYEADAWEEAIAPSLAGKCRVTIMQIARGCLAIEAARLGTADQRRIAAALTRLGWQGVRKINGNIIWEPVPKIGPDEVAL